MKKLCIWLFGLIRNVEQSEVRKFYDMSAEKQINSVTGSTLF